MKRHGPTLATITAAAVLDTAAGLLFSAVEHVSTWDGLYWAVATATTVGFGDITAHTGSGRILTVVVMLTVIPLFGATFSLFTSGLTSRHVHLSEHRLKAHLSEHLARNAPTITPEGPSS